MNHSFALTLTCLVAFGLDTTHAGLEARVGEVGPHIESKLAKFLGENHGAFGYVMRNEDGSSSGSLAEGKIVFDVVSVIERPLLIAKNASGGIAAVEKPAAAAEIPPAAFQQAEPSSPLRTAFEMANGGTEGKRRAHDWLLVGSQGRGTGLGVVEQIWVKERLPGVRDDAY